MAPLLTSPHSLLANRLFHHLPTGEIHDDLVRRLRPPVHLLHAAVSATAVEAVARTAPLYARQLAAATTRDTAALATAASGNALLRRAALANPQLPPSTARAVVEQAIAEHDVHTLLAATRTSSVLFAVLPTYPHLLEVVAAQRPRGIVHAIAGTLTDWTIEQVRWVHAQLAAAPLGRAVLFDALAEASSRLGTASPRLRMTLALAAAEFGVDVIPPGYHHLLYRATRPEPAEHRCNHAALARLYARVGLPDDAARDLAPGAHHVLDAAVWAAVPGVVSTFDAQVAMEIAEHCPQTVTLLASSWADLPPPVFEALAHTPALQRSVRAEVTATVVHTLVAPIRAAMLRHGLLDDVVSLAVAEAALRGKDWSLHEAAVCRLAAWDAEALTQVSAATHPMVHKRLAGMIADGGTELAGSGAARLVLEADRMAPVSCWGFVATDALASMLSSMHSPEEFWVAIRLLESGSMSPQRVRTAAARLVRPRSPERV